MKKRRPKVFGLARRMFSDKKSTLIIYCISIVAFIEMYLALFPAIRDQAAQLNQLMNSYPDAFFKAFGLDKADLTFERVEPFLSSEIFSFIWPILAVIFITSLANYAIVTEVGKGTIELTLAQPISRLRVFMSRYLTAASLFLAFTAVTIFSVMPLATLHNIDYKFDSFLKMGLVCVGFGLATLGLGMLFSAVFSEKGKASFAVGGTLILMYVANVISALKESLSNLQYFSFFHYFAPGTVLGKGQFVDNTFYVFAGVAIVSTVLAAFIFHKKDIAV